MAEEIRPYAAYSVAQAAELLGMDVHTVYRAIEDKKLLAFVPNGNRRGLRVFGYWIIEWMEEGARK